MTVKITTEAWNVVTEGRQCGNCTACCIYLGIEELNKPTNCKCVHLRGPSHGSKRCSIYWRRPVACKEYECFWRSGFGPDHLRPQDCGVLITGYPSDNGSDKVNFTCNVFDDEKVKPHLNDVIAGLCCLPFTDEVRLISIRTRKALLFKNGFIYNCRILQGTDVEELMYAAEDRPLGKYRME